MNGDTFFEWFCGILPLLKEKAVIYSWIMHHTTQLKKNSHLLLLGEKRQYSNDWNPKI